MTGSARFHHPESSARGRSRQTGVRRGLWGRCPGAESAKAGRAGRGCPPHLCPPSRHGPRPTGPGARAKSIAAAKEAAGHHRGRDEHTQSAASTRTYSFRRQIHLVEGVGPIGLARRVPARPHRWEQPWWQLYAPPGLWWCHRRRCRRCSIERAAPLTFCRRLAQAVGGRCRPQPHFSLNSTNSSGSLSVSSTLAPACSCLYCWKAWAIRARSSSEAYRRKSGMGPSSSSFM